MFRSQPGGGRQENFFRGEPPCDGGMLDFWIVEVVICYWEGDKMPLEVKLVAYTPNPEEVCARAAWTSTQWENPFDRPASREKLLNLLKTVIGGGHHSILEHAVFTFIAKGISRACSHQLVRHRIASYTQQSQRYVKFSPDGLEFVTPPSIEGSDLGEEFSDFMRKAAEFYQRLVDTGIPPEDARYVLPNSATTMITVTMNARELWHFFGLRLCQRAQWEIQEVARRMLEEVKKIAPALFDGAGPRCEQLGYCPEPPTMGCGRWPPKEEALKAASKSLLEEGEA